ncbi:DUF58 domain-containing protein [Aquiflexum lacus]|uniref:DUF58 domain-containing protein n=1 Tax=Aquiflexum lacus TaxID=2483805 RepID=UPI001895DFD0|nr:DUF58 domain-containing protein [Aquiflexum lacus]
MDKSAEHLEIIKLNNLQLAAKVISDKLRQGSHVGKRIGYGAEFEQYRHYEPGDDLKRIDWKLFARSEKYQIKESPIESNFHLKLILDLSGSMNYEEEGINRLTYAKILMASLAYIAFLQGDNISLYFLQHGDIVQVVAPGAKSFQSVLYHLEKAEAKGKWQNDFKDFPTLKSREKEMIMMVSDFLQEEREWEALVKSMIHPNKEILLYQILGQQEMQMEMSGNIRFEDLESGHTFHAEAMDLMKDYNQSIQSYLNQLDTTFQLQGVTMLRASLAEPIAELIFRSLSNKQFA